MKLVMLPTPKGATANTATREVVSKSQGDRGFGDLLDVLHSASPAVLLPFSMTHGEAGSTT
jgi:hypothetical protein